VTTAVSKTAVHSNVSQNVINEQVRFLQPTRHIMGHFGNESFPAIICTGIDNKDQPQKNQTKLTHKAKQ